MSVVVVHQVQSATRTVDFVATTRAGRTMKISVEAMKDISDDAVKSDVEQSLGQGIEVRTAPQVMGYVESFITWFLLWCLTGAAIAFFAMALDMSDIVSLSYPKTMWPEWIPLIGSLTLGTGLVRLWLLLGPVFAVMAFLAVDKEKQGALSGD